MNELLEFFYSAFNQFLMVIKNFRFIDAVDIIAVAFIIYSIVHFARRTRAKQLIGGISILLAIWVVAELFEMTALSVILRTLVDSGIVVLVIIFQPELRNALELVVSRTNLMFSRKGNDIRTNTIKCIDNVCDACETLQKSKTGALIVFERNTMLEDVTKTGTVINSDAIKELICNIFYPNTPLHDGAILIRHSSIYAAGCILPLSHNPRISKDMGTRHRAAIGMSENSDAIVVVLSEETGVISVAEKGMIKRNYTITGLRSRLMNELVSEVDEHKSVVDIIMNKMRKGGKKSDEKAD